MQRARSPMGVPRARPRPLTLAMPPSPLDRLLVALAAPRPALAMGAPRVLWAAAAALTVAWVAGPLGGVGRAKGGETALLFNWHPALMVASIGLWTEAALQFAAYGGGKRTHAAIHAMATTTATVGVTAAWLSHVLHAPPIPSLYTPHALLGALTLTSVYAQAALGAASFLWPGASPAARASFAPAHRAAGKVALALTAATAAAGFQEKAAVLLVERGVPPRSATIALPAGAALLLAGSVTAALLKLMGGGGGRDGPPPGFRPVPAADSPH